MQNKCMITPTKKDKSNGKEEEMNYSIRYITPEYAKNILDRMERKALDRGTTIATYGYNPEEIPKSSGYLW